MASRATITGLMLALLVGCSAPPEAPSSTPALPDADRAAVIATIAAINDTAAGPVPDQQAVLTALVDPALAADQAACAAATITIRIDPVLDRLAPDLTSDDAAGTTAGATPGGTVYRLPVLLEVYTEGLRTGTDLANLKLAVSDGIAHTFPLCLV